MIQTNLLAHGHADLVTHVAYDFYGERLATCSADQRIKLFKRSHQGSWDVETEWKAHDAPILRLSFAHPLHGSLLASCSHDKTVRIWEEPSTASGSSSSKEGRWIDKGILGGAKGSVRDVAFGPADPGLGLRVASISTDSHLRIHLSLDPNLSDWSLAHDVYLPSLPSPSSSEDISTDTSNQPSSSGAGSVGNNELALGGWGLSWCKDKWWGSIIAAFSGLNPVVKIISLDPSPSAILHLTPPSSASSSSSPLTALSWAPSCGRSYHHIATGSRDGVLRIWKVTPPPDDDQVKHGGNDEWKGEVVGEFGNHARIGMVDWNATGTVLTVSDDEGIIRIYKQTYAKEWKIMGKMTAEEPNEEVNGS